MRHPTLINRQLYCFLLLLTLLAPSSATATKLVIAQGGASGYLMGNSSPAVTMAVLINSDIIKFDTVLTADNEVIVVPSPKIKTYTNVTEIFPDRTRDDGEYYALDFTLEELRRLTLQGGAEDFPDELLPRFRIPTLQEELSLIYALNKNRDVPVQLAIEIKQIWLHRRAEKDLSKAVLNLLQKFGYGGASGRVLLMSYDTMELQRIRKQLLPEMGMPLQLVQLIESNEGEENMVEEWGELKSYNYDWMFSKSGLRSLAGSVAAIALPKYMLADSDGKLLLNDFVRNSQQLGTMIFTFPVQKEKNNRVPFLNSFDEELEFFYFTAGVDGIITDYCKDTLFFLKNRVEQPAATLAAEPEETVPPSMEIISSDPLQLTSPLEFEVEE